MVRLLRADPREPEHAARAELDRAGARRACSALLDRYVEAFERYDMEALALLVREDATQSMPPYELWLSGREDIFRFCSALHRLPRLARPAGERRERGAYACPVQVAAEVPEAVRGFGGLAGEDLSSMRKGELESRILILVTLALTAFGIVMVYSATSDPAAVDGGNPNYYVERQVGYALVGIVLMVLAQRADFRRLRALAPPLVLGSLGLLVAVLVVGPSVNGARRWISLGPALFQPSELAKLALAIWAASYLARRPPPRTLRELARPVGLLAGLFALLLLAEPDLGTAIALLLMLGAMLLVAGTPARVLGSGVALTAALGMAAIWAEPYSRARFLAFMHPWRNAQGSGFQVVQAMIGMGSGGIFGVGLGQGVQKFFYLPEAPTDMMLATIGEELGLIGVGCVIAAYALFGFAGLRIALNCRDPFGKRLAVGLTVLVCGQAVVNVAAVMGLAPLTGIPLPFLSYGGSSLVILLASVGILLNIAQRGNAQTASVRDRGRRDGRARAAGTGGRRSAERVGSVRELRGVAGSGRGQARP